QHLRSHTYSLVFVTSSFCALRSPSSSIFTFFFQRSPPPRDLHSFPTRRSSDLQGSVGGHRVPRGHRGARRHRHRLRGNHGRADRSEEHTSELQSRGHLVCRLLLEKKKRGSRHAKYGQVDAGRDEI